MIPDELPSNVFSLVDRLKTPQAVESEQAILGGILLDPTAMSRVVNILKPEMFYLSMHQQIYKAAIALHMDDDPIDLISIAQALADKNQLEKIGKSNLIGLLETCVSAINIDYHAQLVAEKAKRRDLILTCRNLIASAHECSSTWDDLYSHAETEIFSLSSASQNKGIKPSGDFMCEEMSRLDSIQSGTADPGIKSGFYDLDAMTQGFKRNQLIIVGGRPGSGKSAMATAIATNVAAQGHPVVIFSLEMSGGEIARRMLSSDSDVAASRIDSANLRPTDMEAIVSSMARLSALPIFIDESESVSPSSVLSQCRHLKAQTGELGLIVIDYLHLMLDGGVDEVRELGQITRAFKRMARSLNTPILLLSQLNRAVENQTNKRPSMKDLRSSGSIEQDADLILLLYRDEYYNPDTPDRGIAEVIVAKNRSGAVGTVKLLFEPQFTRFRNLQRSAYAEG